MQYCRDCVDELMTLVFDEASGDPALYVEGSEPHPDPVRVGGPSHVWSAKGLQKPEHCPVRPEAPGVPRYPPEDSQTPS